MPTRHTSSRAGFSLPELVISLAVIALVACIAVPMYFARSEVTLENAAVQLCRDLRAAQNRAAYLGITASVEFEDDGTGYEIVDDEGGPIPGPHGTDEFVRRYDRDGVFEGVRIHDLELSGAPARLRYGPRGSALEGGTITIAFEDETRSVSVRRGDGLLSILDSSSDWIDDGL